MQNRDILCEYELCNHRNTSGRKFNHLATRCVRLLYINYVQRHNEVLTCIYLHYALQFGLKLKQYPQPQSCKNFDNDKANTKVIHLYFGNPNKLQDNWINILDKTK